MRYHELKCWPEPFQAVLEGRKFHEFRKNDRDFRVGDTLILQEWDPKDEIYTGRRVHLVVMHFSEGFGIPVGYCCMSIWPESERIRYWTRSIAKHLLQPKDSQSAG